jgi:HAD superfamily hydrolase (TIGR01509 family)
MLKAIIFDMDGLMVDTEPLSRQAWDAVLDLFGYALSDEVYFQMIGRRSDESAHMAWKAYDLPISAEELLARKTAVFETKLAQGIPIMPGLIELQAEIGRRQIPWAVATSSPRHHAEIILAQLELTAVCHALASGNEVANGKPAPDIYLLAAQRLGIAPEDCLALEDSIPGSQAAVTAGMVTVAVPNGRAHADAFSHAHDSLPSLHEVLAHLDELLTSSRGIVTASSNG